MTENFIENLPGYPDNIRCDGEGNYWIALSSGRTISWDILFKFSFVRKMATILEKFVKPTRLFQDSGILRVTLQGQPLTIYSDRHLILVTCGIKVGKDLYYGSLYAPYVSKIDLSQY
ncbi:putative protein STRICTOSIDINE SYNTHASE-LIKE 6 [Cocos nucifera]|nr:putative protein STRICTOSIDINE SYNTHASE-LIKE 6 [Cocos nucifera]